VNTKDTNGTIYFPQITTNFFSIYLLQWEILHRPPIWASGYQWVCTKRQTISYFEYFRITSIGSEVIDPITNTVISAIILTVNDDIEKMNKVFGKSIVQPYNFVAGDRLKFSYYLEGNKVLFNYFPDELDFEILSGGMTNDTGSGSTYLKNDLGEYILDADGNKQKDIHKISIVIANFAYKNYPYLADFAKINSGTVVVIVEIYRPAPDTQSNIFFALGPRHPILNPHKDNRNHQGGPLLNSTDVWTRDQDWTNTVSARGTLFSPDVWVRPRFTGNMAVGLPFPIESSYFSDFFESQSGSIGRANIQNLNDRRYRYVSKLLYSGSFIQDTKTNDLSKVDSTNAVTLADKFGPINWMEEVGYVLKVLQTKKPTSIPIGRVAFDQADSNRPVVGTTTLVLGVPQPHDSDYGTTHGTGVVRHDDRYWFPDLYAG